MLETLGQVVQRILRGLERWYARGLAHLGLYSYFIVVGVCRQNMASLLSHVGPSVPDQAVRAATPTGERAESAPCARARERPRWQVGA